MSPPRFLARLEARTLLVVLLLAGMLWAFATLAAGVAGGRTQPGTSRSCWPFASPATRTTPWAEAMPRRRCATSRPWAAPLGSSS
jgi:hypothetical protein